MKTILKKLKKSETSDEILSVIEEVKQLRIKELDFSFLVKVIEKLGGEQLDAKGGSAMRFHHPDLEANSIRNGHFAIHIIHGKNPPKVRMNDFKKYFYPVVVQIIEILNKR